MHKMSLTIDADGNIVVAAPGDGAEVLIAKFTTTGELLWQRSVSAAMPGDDERDSVSPLLLDGSASIAQSRLATRRRGRLATAGVVAACALTFGIAGFGLAGDHAPSAAPVRSLAAPIASLVARTATAPAASLATPKTKDDTTKNETATAEATTKTIADEPAGTPVDAVDAKAPTHVSVAKIPASRTPASKTPASKTPASRTPAAKSSPSKRTAAPAPKAQASSASELRAATLALLQHGKLAAAADRARALVATSPDDAFSYLALGSALQDQGLSNQARAVYYACAERAHGGDVSECMALAQQRPEPPASE